MNYENELHKMIDEALEDSRPAIAIVTGRHATAAMQQGSLKDLTRMILVAFDQEPKLRRPFELALQYFKDRDEHKNEKPDCDSCPEKDDCPVQVLMKFLDKNPIAEFWSKEIPDLDGLIDLFNNPKGGCSKNN